MLKDIEIVINKNGIRLVHSKGFVYITKKELDNCMMSDGKINVERISKLYEYKYDPKWMAA